VESSDDEGLGEEDASKQGMIADIDANQDIYLVNVHTDKDIFGANNLDSDEVLAEPEVVVKDVNLSVDEVTLAQALTALKKQVKPIKRLEQMRLDEELAFKLQAVEEEEEERLARVKAQQVKEANIAWDDVQSKIKADYQLAQRLKHFAAKRAEEKRNRPTTRAQQRSIMCTYLKIMKGWKPKDLKNKSFANIKELFDKAMKMVNTFVDYRTELVEESSKKADAKIAEDGKHQMYLTFGKMLKNFDREDLEVLWSIVKARFKTIKPVNYMDNFLLLNLKTMFEHHVEDNVWKNQQGLVKVLNWKFYDSYVVHCVTIQSMIFYLSVEKMYPLIKHTLHQMFNDVKLQVDYEYGMAFELLILVKKQLKEGYIP
ncbi:hypothetical protein Tco_1498415, partial [Tanacetum coccineum]